MKRFLRRMLRGRTSRHLVVSYLYPPAAETSGIVVAKRIRAWGREVDVIANEPPAGRKTDPRSTEVAGELVREVIRLKGRENRLTDWQNVERFAARGLVKIQDRERRNGRYRSVYSRSMMPASHVLAALYKIEHSKVPWTAEFSDPLVLDTRGERRTAPAEGAAAATLRRELRRRGFEAPGSEEMFELVEHAVYAMADEIVFTNENQRDLMLGHITSPALRARAERVAVVVAHPQPDPSLYGAAPTQADLDPATLNIGYFGVFFGIRSVQTLVAPFAALDARDRAQVRLRLYVAKPAAARRQVAELGLEETVEVHGFVPYLEFLNLTTQLDWLLVADSAATEHHGLNPYLPSKLSDYLGSGTPVWAMVEDGSPMSRWPGLTTTPLGDVEAARAHLKLALIRARSHGAPEGAPRNPSVE